MTPRHPVKLAALVASACLVALAAQAQPAPAAAPADDIVLVHRFTIPPGQSWGTISVPLLPAAWRIGHADGPRASEAQLRSVLGQLGAIEVGARCTGWVEATRVYPCGFMVRGFDVAGVVVERLSVVGDGAAPDAQRAQAAVQNQDHPMLLDVSRFVRFRAPLPDAGHAYFGRELQFEIRAVSDPLVPSEFDRSSGMVVLRGGLPGSRL